MQYNRNGIWRKSQITKNEIFKTIPTKIHDIPVFFLPLSYIENLLHSKLFTLENSLKNRLLRQFYQVIISTWLVWLFPSDLRSLRLRIITYSNKRCTWFKITLFKTALKWLDTWGFFNLEKARGLIVNIIEDNKIPDKRTTNKKNKHLA